MIAEGTYRAKPLGGAFDKNKKTGSLGVGVQFEFTDQALKGQKIWWVGYLTEKAIEFTMKTLATLDLSNAPKTDDDGRFDASQFGYPNKEYELVVTVEEYEGKTRNRVKFVNEIGGGMKFGNLDPKSLAFELTSVNFAAEIMAAKMKLGTKPTAQPKQVKNFAPQATQQTPPGFDKNEEIPF